MKNEAPETKQTYPSVALIGGGYWGKNLVRNFSELKALAAICDRRKESLSQFSEDYPDIPARTFEEILDDPAIPAVAIATPAETHGRFVREALLAGKDVFVEKPLCLSVEEGEDLVALAREKERILMVGHLLWYHPAVLKLKSLIDNGDLGRIQYIYSNRLNLGKIRQEENILWSFAPHDISVILGLLDESPDTIQAQGGNYLHPRISDVTVSLLSFPSGVKAHIFVSWLHPFKEQKLIVVGDRKMAVFDDMEKKDKLLLYPHSIEWLNHIPVPNKAEAQSVSFEAEEPLLTECRHFLESVQTRTAPRTDGEEGLRVLRVLKACQEALDPNTQAALPFSQASARLRPGYTAHETAHIDGDVEIGEGTRIWHFSHIMKGSKLGKACKIGQNVVLGPKAIIGDNVKIQNNVSVYEGVTLEDDVFCGPSMVFTNVFNPRSEIPRMDALKPTRVKRGATLGANCTVLCGLTLGAYAFVGAGAVVTEDVPDYALVVGNPGRVAGWMCRCGVKLGFKKDEAECGECGRGYRKVGDEVEAVEASG